MTVVYDINCHIVNTSFRYFSGVEGEARFALLQKVRYCGTGWNNLMKLNLETAWALKSGGEV